MAHAVGKGLSVAGIRDDGLCSNISARSSDVSLELVASGALRLEDDIPDPPLLR